MKQTQLLHSECLSRVPLICNKLVALFEARVSDLRNAPYAIDPNVSIVIRARNNAAQLKNLLEDIRVQNYDGKVQVIVVDTESDDQTVEIAQSYGAKVITIIQQEFNYPKALNLGFAAASHDWIYSFVDHSALSHRNLLKTASRWSQREDVAAVYGATLPNANASFSERISYGMFFRSYLRIPARQAMRKDIGGGFMAANTLLVKRSVWRELGGFDESYGAGGEDVALGSEMMKAGYAVVSEPALSVYHSHGLGPLRQLRQLHYWLSLKHPMDFNGAKLLSYRKDLQPTKRRQ